MDIKRIATQVGIKNNKKVYKFVYNKYGQPVNNQELLRIKKLRIPPNWKDVCISNSPISHLQVLGKDSKERVQYIYHPMWVFLTSSDKYVRMGRFSKKIGLFEKKIKNDALRSEPSNIYAILFTILKHTHIRIGNECYAKDNNTYGLITLEKRHITLDNNKIRLKFTGKKGVKQDIVFKDPLCLNYFKRVLPRLKPNQRVFPNISGTQVNKYLQDTIGNEFTCKDFRTYASNIMFLKHLCTLPEPTSNKDITNNLKNVYDLVAEKLGHTRAVSKNSYIMKLIPEQYSINPKQFVGKNPKSIFCSILKLN